MSNFYLLSEKFDAVQHAPLALAITLVISGGEGYFRNRDVLDHMTRLIRDGIPFDSQHGTEIGRWDKRSFDVLSPAFVANDMYYAWADPDWWNYSPPLAVYTKAEFMELFQDCCRNFVAAQPERRDEFAAALAANGMSL